MVTKKDVFSLTAVVVNSLLDVMFYFILKKLPLAWLVCVGMLVFVL